MLSLPDVVVSDVVVDPLVVVSVLVLLPVVVVSDVVVEPGSRHKHMALNVLNNAFDLYYIGGLRLNWNLSGYYTAKNERKILSLNQDIIGLQQETFLFNTNLNLKQQNAELSKLQELIVSDSEIIQLRESIKNTAKNQLDFGTVTSNDYITYLNAEDQAKQGLLLHQIQLLMAQYNYQTTSGN